MALSSFVSIAVIGTGVIGPRHAQSIVNCADARLHCIVDSNPEAEDVANKFQVPFFQSTTQMLRCGDVPDAAIVCTPNSTHVGIGKELLEAGIHVLVEKPIATTVLSAQELIDAALRNRKSLLVGHHRRFNPYVTTTRRALLQGVIGAPVAISGIWAILKPQSYFDPPNAWRAKAGDGGVILINLIHEIDTLQYLLGPVSRVYAEQSSPQRGHEAEESAAVVLRFSSGVVGTFLVSDATPSAHNFESGTGENPLIPQAGKDFYRIFGTQGTLSVGDMEISRYREQADRSWSSPLQVTPLAVDQDVPFDEQIKHFVQVVKGLETPRCSGDDGLKALVVCEAIKQAISSRAPVDVRLSTM